MKVQQKRRENLFRKTRPVIREYQAQDAKWLWAASRSAGFNLPRDEFLKVIQDTLMQADSVYILEDRNAEFKAGSGPVGIVLATFDTWSLCPHVDWFPWATPRNILRCTVAFLQKHRYVRGTGCIKLFTKHKTWFKGLKRYLPIYYAGGIPSGRPDGDEHIFYLRGREHGRNSRRSYRDGRTGERVRESESTEVLASGDSPATAGNSTVSDECRVVH